MTQHIPYITEIYSCCLLPWYFAKKATIILLFFAPDKDQKEKGKEKPIIFTTRTSAGSKDKPHWG